MGQGLGLVSLGTVAFVCLVVIALRRGFLVTLLAAMCGTVLGFIGTMTGIFIDILHAIDDAARALQ